MICQPLTQPLRAVNPVRLITTVRLQAEFLVIKLFDFYSGWRWQVSHNRQWKTTVPFVCFYRCCNVFIRKASVTVPLVPCVCFLCKTCESWTEFWCSHLQTWLTGIMSSTSSSGPFWVPFLGNQDTVSGRSTPFRPFSCLLPFFSFETFWNSFPVCMSGTIYADLSNKLQDMTL